MINIIKHHQIPIILLLLNRSPNHNINSPNLTHTLDKLLLILTSRPGNNLHSVAGQFPRDFGFGNLGDCYVGELVDLETQVVDFASGNWGGQLDLEVLHVLAVFPSALEGLEVVGF